MYGYKKERKLTFILIYSLRRKHSIKGIPFNLGTVEVPKLSFVKKSFSI